jgi:hypothetical protein
MTHGYTWSHSIDEGSGLRNGASAGQGNIYNRKFDRGNSEFDVRHRYVGTVVYELPFWTTARTSWRAFSGGGEPL